MRKPMRSPSAIASTNGTRYLLALPAALVVLAGQVQAHHSWSEYDANLPVLIEGSVSKLEWKSPHARLYVDVADANGDSVQWNIELPSPNTLMRRGWKRNDLQPGDIVKVSGIRARNFPTIGIARSVLDGNGDSMFSGTIGPDE